jgi:transposase-like protein
MMTKDVEIVRGKMRQSFTDDEKRRIVADSLSSDLSLNQFAKRVGIAPPTLCVWRKRFKGYCTREDKPHQSQEMRVQVPKDPQIDLFTLTKRCQDLESELSHLKKVFGNKLIQLELQKWSG